MKPSRVASILFILTLLASVVWAQHHGGANNSFPPASVTSMRNFPAASATSMGSLPPWTFNNQFGFNNYNNGFGGYNNGAAGWNSGYGNFRTGFSGWNNASVGGRGHHRHRGHYGSYGYDSYNGGYGYGYYAYPVISENELGGSFYNDVNARMNEHSYSDDQAEMDPPPQTQQQPYVIQQQPAPAQPIVFIVDRDGNMKPYDYQQTKRSASAADAAPDSKSTSATQPTVDEVKTVLVYRDGHRREIANYAIMGNKLYLSPHGSVALSELDIPATVAANDERGVDFRMPAAKP